MLIKTYKRSLSYRAAKHKIDRHLSDINDTISDEDIKRVSIPTGTEDHLVINNGVIEFRKADEDKTERLLTKANNPWNIVS